MRPILVVDDNPDLCILLRKILQKLGYTVDCAERGQAAMDHLRTHPTELMILDYMLPDMDGLQVLSAIRNDPQTHALPVIMFSAVNDSAVISEAMKRGASDYWIKGEFTDFRQMATRLATALQAAAVQNQPTAPSTGWD